MRKFLSEIESYLTKYDPYFQRYGFLVVLLVMVLAFGFSLWRIYFQLPLELMHNVPGLVSVARSLSFAIFSIAVIIIIGLWVLSRALYRVHKTQSWLIEVARYQGEKIGAFCPYETKTESVRGKNNEAKAKWPWGQHDTAYLGHLEAAARRFWVLYEPSDPSTAPTNDMVSDWLQSERGISREKARAIASMLRPDGLPTGPRR